MKILSLVSALSIALSACSAAGKAPSEAAPTASAFAMTTTTPTVLPEPTPSILSPASDAPEPTAVPTVEPTPTLAGCPALPVTIDEIALLTPERALACFGDALLTFEAYVPPHPYGSGDARDYSLSPAWLDGTGGSVVALTAGQDASVLALGQDGRVLVLANVPPALGRCDSGQSIPECPFHIFEGHWALVSAQFDAPVARTCRAVGIVEGSTFTDAQAVAECRRLLVVQSVGAAVPSASAASGG